MGAQEPHSAASVAPYNPYSLEGQAAQDDWVQHLELDEARALGQRCGCEPLRVLVLYGSLRERSFSKLLAYEFSR